MKRPPNYEFERRADGAGAFRFRREMARRGEEVKYFTSPPFRTLTSAINAAWEHHAKHFSGEWADKWESV